MRLVNLITRSPKSAAFTRLDLLATLAAIFLIAVLALPAMASTVQPSRTAICKSNLRILIRAWQLYADDNAGRLVHNFHGDSIAGGSVVQSGAAPWASGWFGAGSTDSTNTALILDPKYARLATYLPSATRAHKCVADEPARDPRTRQPVERVRSVSMNGTVGDGNVTAGPWIPIYQQVKWLGDFRFPSPSEVTVFLEEHPDSINDPLFFPPDRTRWIDFPGNLHDGAVVASFADGAALLQRWRGSALLAVPTITTRSVPVGDPDLSWLSYHSARRSAQHF